MARYEYFVRVVTWYLVVKLSTTEHSTYLWRQDSYKGMPIDHFNESNETFDLRYLINDTWWDPNGGPIFFCPGSEGAIEEFAENTGLMWDWAQEFRAMLVFPEHRFYGHTLPYGNLSYEMPYVKTLTVDQAMEDFVVFLQWLKHNVTGAQNSSVIAFGGSYGSMLSAWMRLKYPSVISGAIASSAPIRQLIGGDAPCWAFGEKATLTFANAAPKCDEAIRKASDIISDRLQTDEGRRWLNKNFQLCKETQIRVGPHVDAIMYRISDAWQYLAMFDYPYFTDFVVPLPAWPVKEACKHLTAEVNDDDALLRNVYKAISIFYNYTGTLKCLSLRPNRTSEFARNWNFQTCTELAFRLCNNGSDILQNSSWDEEGYFNRCTTAFGSTPRYDWVTKNYGLERLKAATNIIFTNCQLDPWYSSGITQEQLKGSDPSLIVIDIPNAAHHYDLRANHLNDTKDIIDARNHMKRIIHSWLGMPDQRAASAANCDRCLSFTVGLFLWRLCCC